MKTYITTNDIQNKINKEVAIFLKKHIENKERILYKEGKISNKGLSLSDIGNVVNTSPTWVRNVLNGEKTASDDFLIKIANYLEIDEHELFKLARKVHPNIAEEMRKHYLGDFYIPSKDLL